MLRCALPLTGSFFSSNPAPLCCFLPPPPFAQSCPIAPWSNQALLEQRTQYSYNTSPLVLIAARPGLASVEGLLPAEAAEARWDAVAYQGMRGRRPRGRPVGDVLPSIHSGSSVNPPLHPLCCGLWLGFWSPRLLPLSLGRC